MIGTQRNAQRIVQTCNTVLDFVLKSLHTPFCVYKLFSTKSNTVLRICAIRCTSIIIVKWTCLISFEDIKVVPLLFQIVSPSHVF